MTDLNFIQLKSIPQLFLKFKKKQLVLVVAKVVDDLIITGLETEKINFIKDFNKTF